MATTTETPRGNGCSLGVSTVCKYQSQWCWYQADANDRLQKETLIYHPNVFKGMRGTARRSRRGSQLNVGLMLTAKSACFPAQSNYYCLDKTKFSLSPKHFHSVQNIFTQYKSLSLRPKTFSLSPKHFHSVQNPFSPPKNIFTQPNNIFT